MALPNMIAENASQSSVASSNSGFPKYDETDPEGSSFKILIALSKHKERPHLSLLPSPVNPSGRAAQDLRDAFRQDMEIYRRQEEVGYRRQQEEVGYVMRQHIIRVHQHLKWQCFITSRNWGCSSTEAVIWKRIVGYRGRKIQRGECISLLEECIGKYNSCI
jgi:hypothetical protein